MTVEPIPVVEFVFVPPPVIIEEVIEEVIKEEEEPEPVIPVFVPVWDIVEEEPDENIEANLLADELRQGVNEDQISYPTPEASIS